MEEIKKVTVDYNNGEGDFSSELNDKSKRLVSIVNDASSRTLMLKQAYIEMKGKNPNAVCPSCGGMPVSKSVCEVCGSGSAKEKIVMKQEVEIETANQLFIPNQYVGKVFDADKIRQSHPSLTGTKELEEYLSMLTRISEQLNRKSLQLSSLFISAPGGFGKEHFAYSLLQLGVTNGMTVFPYLDLGEVSRLLTAYEKDNYRDPIRKEIGFTDVDLNTAQVCVLKVPHSDNLESYKIAMKVIDRRARRGLPTIIMSRYNFNFFTSLDKFGELKSMQSYDNVSPKNLRLVEMKARVNTL